MLGGLSIALAEVQAGHTSENLLNKILKVLPIHFIKQNKSQNKYTII